MEKLVEEIVKLIRTQADRIDALDRRCVELESRPTLRYCGVWSAEGEYSVGDIVTDSGSMWHCKVNHGRSRPGHDGGVGWTLCVKRGVDGKDLR